MRKLISLFVIATFLLLAFQPTANYAQTNSPKNRIVYNVKSIVDGDTFWVEDGSPSGLKIRLIGVDAPESRKAFRKEVGYFGKESKAYLSLLLKDKKVFLSYDVAPKDRYGRSLCYVYLPDGRFVNLLLVKHGFAQVMTVPPNVKFSKQFLKAQQEARRKKLGLWAHE